ncbi:MAG TPA: septation regulator SpoVG [Symbiobacteriaceae bacterium]
MRITDVRVRRLQSSEGKLKATCSVVFDDAFVVHDLRVVEGANGIFVAMPQRKVGEGQYRDVAHPITAEAREALQKAVLEAFLASGQESSATA